MLVGRSERGGRVTPLIRHCGLGSSSPFRARGRRRAGPVVAVMSLSLEARYAWASLDEAGTIFVEVCVWPAKVYACGTVIVGSELETWRDRGNVSFVRVSDEGGMFSALAMASGGFWAVGRDREA